MAEGGQAHAYAFQIKVAPHRSESVCVLAICNTCHTKPSLLATYLPTCIVIYYPAWQKGFSSINHAGDDATAAR